MKNKNDINEIGTDCFSLEQLLQFIDKNIAILRPFYRYVLIHGEKI